SGAAFSSPGSWPELQLTAKSIWAKSAGHNQRRRVIDVASFVGERRRAYGSGAKMASLVPPCPAIRPNWKYLSAQRTMHTGRHRVDMLRRTFLLGWLALAACDGNSANGVTGSVHLGPDFGPAPEVAATPEFDPAEGTFARVPIVTIRTATPG